MRRTTAPIISMALYSKHPAVIPGSIRYLSVPLGYRLWNKKQAKLEIAAEMVCHAMDGIDSDRQIFQLCNSWNPKGCVAGLMDE